MKPFAASLLGASRSAILGALLLRPERELHVRELSRVSGVGVGTLQRELRTLLELGLVTRREAGRQVFYAADRTSPVFEELAGLLRKTSGLADVLREALLPLESDIRYAFIYGSMAAAAAGPHSDVDVMVVGDASFADVAKAVYEAQRVVGREVNPTVMKARELATRARLRDGFVASVLDGPKIWLIGDENDLVQPRKGRSAASM